MLLELHLHTSRHSSCSNLDPVEAVHRVVAKGLQGLVITEHHYLWSEEELARLRREAELHESFVLLAGQEVETDLGHVLVFGAERTIPRRQGIEELRLRHREAALVWAHPFRHDRVPHDEDLLERPFDAVELFNHNHSSRGNYCALAAWHRLKFVATAGSDAHTLDAVGVFPTQLDHPVRSIAELVREIHAGRCRPFFKEIPKSGSNLSVTEITIGTKGEDEFRQRVVVKRFQDDHKWRKERRALRTIEALLDHGFRTSTFRVPQILEVNDETRLLIEEGQRGKLLFDLLRNVSPAVGEEYFALAARWLAQMHTLRLRVGTVEGALRRERRRLVSYGVSFERTNSPYVQQARQILDHIAPREEALFNGRSKELVQIHGDYHPKNIIIGQDRAQDASTVFISVIDFGSTMLHAPAFDVGCFLAQLRYQLRESPRVLQVLERRAFLDAYLSSERDRSPSNDFNDQVTLFEARANMSIASFLIKVGKGESPDMEHLVRRTRQLLAIGADPPADPETPPGPR